jgi:hypothetical protein
LADIPDWVEERRGGGREGGGGIIMTIQLVGLGTIRSRSILVGI